MNDKHSVTRPVILLIFDSLTQGGTSSVDDPSEESVTGGKNRLRKKIGEEGGGFGPCIVGVNRCTGRRGSFQLNGLSSTRSV